jgi:hypothetical protein
MSYEFTAVGRERALAMYADWSNRIAQGELPSATPARPQGLERNVVITLWDWADPKVYLHDAISSDKRNPLINANGPIYGALEDSGDYLTVPDPVHNSTSQAKLTVRDPQTPSSADTPPLGLSPYWGNERIRNSQTTVHSFAMDRQARVWAAARIRKPQTPAWCRAESDHPSAKFFPISSGDRQLELYDPKTKETNDDRYLLYLGHINFDANDVLWSSFGPAGVEGWFDTRIWDKTHDEKQAQGWSAFVLGLQRQRQARRIHRTESAAGSSQRQADQRDLLRRLASARWVCVGVGDGDARCDRSFRSRCSSARDGPGGVLRGAVEQSEGPRPRLRASRHGRRR